MWMSDTCYIFSLFSFSLIFFLLDPSMLFCTPWLDFTPANSKLGNVFSFRSFFVLPICLSRSLSLFFLHPSVFSCIKAARRALWELFFLRGKRGNHPHIHLPPPALSLSSSTSFLKTISHFHRSSWLSTSFWFLPSFPSFLLSLPSFLTTLITSYFFSSPCSPLPLAQTTSYFLFPRPRRKWGRGWSGVGGKDMRASV